MHPDALRGHLDSLILAVLESQPRHGYAIIEALQVCSGGALDLPTGTVYPALRRLEAAGSPQQLMDHYGWPQTPHLHPVCGRAPCPRDATAPSGQSFSAMVRPVCSARPEPPGHCQLRCGGARRVRLWAA